MSGPDYYLQLAGTVTPPADMMAAARVELSEEGFARLMQVTGGETPTPWQLVREVEFERTGAYPPEPPLNVEARKRVMERALYMAAAIEDLSPEQLAELFTRTHYAPSARDVALAVEAAREARRARET